MAQQIIPAAQLVPKFQGIERCNNYVVLQSILCSPKCKIVGQILLDHPLSYALTTTVDVPVRVGYQGIVVKVSAFYTKFLAQPWQTMFKKKDVIQYPRFTKLIIADLMKKYPSISPRLEEDYHSIKDDISLVSVYTTGNVTVQGMLIPYAFLTDEIRATDDYKEYETVFVGVVVPMNQPQPGKKRKQSVGETNSPSKSLKVTIKQKQVVEVGQDDESYASKFVASMLNDDDDDSGNRLEPRSHKENPEVIHDDDDNKAEKKDEKKDDEMGSLEIRTEKMQTPIPTPPRSPRIILSLDKNINQELSVTVSPSTTTSSKDPHKKRHISNKYSHLPTNNDLIKANLKRVVADIVIQERDAFQYKVPALISKEFDAQTPKIIEELFKNYV
ncbi:hypothetical protein Tco_0885885 [Tanacetum coccineum]